MAKACATLKVNLTLANTLPNVSKVLRPVVSILALITKCGVNSPLFFRSVKLLPGEFVCIVPKECILLNNAALGHEATENGISTAYITHKCDTDRNLTPGPEADDNMDSGSDTSSNADDAGRIATVAICSLSSTMVCTTVIILFNGLIYLSSVKRR